MVKTSCLLVFIIEFDGFRTVNFTVNSDDVERGEVTFDLSPDLLSGVGDVCSVSGVISGGNLNGNSSTTEVQLPPGRPTDTKLQLYSCS